MSRVPEFDTRRSCTGQNKETDLTAVRGLPVQRPWICGVRCPSTQIGAEIGKCERHAFPNRISSYRQLARNGMNYPAADGGH